MSLSATDGAGWALGQLWGGAVRGWGSSPLTGSHPPARSADWGKARDTGVDEMGVEGEGAFGSAGVGGTERRGTGRPTWP